MKLAASIVLAAAILVGCQRAPDCPPVVRVVAYTASWCAPCRQAKPILAKLRADGIRVELVDIDDSPERAKRAGIVSVPEFHVYTANGSFATPDIDVVVRAVKGAL